jgi:hypothetical protein
MNIFFWIFSVKSSISFSSMQVSCIITPHNFFPIILALLVKLLPTKLPITLLHPVLLALPIFTSRHPPCNIFFSKTLSPTCSLNIRYKSHSYKAVTCFLNTHYRCAVGLGKEWNLISLDKMFSDWKCM